MENYSKDKVESTQFVVYDRRNPKRYTNGWAVTWQAARELGAKALGVPSEFTWAVALLDGETQQQAVARGVGIDSMWKRTEVQS